MDIDLHQKLEECSNKISDRYRKPEERSTRQIATDTLVSAIAGAGRRVSNTAETLISNIATHIIPEPGSSTYLKPPTTLKSSLKTQPAVKITPATPVKREPVTPRKSGKTPKMATMTERPRTRTQDTPRPPGSYPKSPMDKLHKAATPKGYKKPQDKKQKQAPGAPGAPGPPGPPGDPGNNPDGDPDDPHDSEHEQDEENNQEDNQEGQENIQEEEQENQGEDYQPDWISSRWTPAPDLEPHPLSSHSSSKKPKIPTPPTNTGTHEFNTTGEFDNWAYEVLDYLKIHEVNIQTEQALSYTSGYTSGVAREFLRNWRKNEKNEGKFLMEFLNDLRKFCIPPNYEEKLWQEFLNIKQTVNGRSRPIKQVGTELQTMKMRVPRLTYLQLFHQLKIAMDQDLHQLIAPHIHDTMDWDEIMEIAVRYDAALKMKNQQKSTTNPSRKPINNSYRNSYNRNTNKTSGWKNSNTWKPRNFGPSSNNNNNRNTSYSSPNTSFQPRKPRDTKDVTCYNCNKKGHYANKCPEKSIRSAAQSVRPKTNNSYPRKPFVRTAAVNISHKEGKLPSDLYDDSSKHMIINVEINCNPARALVDQQTTGSNLISNSYVTTHQRPTIQLKKEIAVHLALQGSRGKSTHYVKTNLGIGNHKEPVSFCIAALADWDIIIGEPLLRELKAKIDVAKQTMTIQPEMSQSPILIKATVRPPKDNANESPTTVSSARIMVAPNHESPEELLQQAVSKKKQKTEKQQLMSQASDSIPYSYENAVRQLGYDPIRTFPDVFPETKPTELPPLRKINHKIDIIDEDKHHAMRSRRIKPSEAFLPQLREKIDKELKTGRVYPAQDSSACSIFMVQKFDKPKEARFLHDLVDRNANTRKDHTPIPDISSIINTVARHPFRSKIDLTDGYHNVRIQPEDEKYTSFYTPFGTFRTKVMQQGDCNAPATFMKLMNWIFHDMLGRNVYIYLDDILIFDKTREEHIESIRQVCLRLRQHKLYGNRSKTMILPPELMILGLHSSFGICSRTTHPTMW